MREQHYLNTSFIISVLAKYACTILTRLSQRPAIVGEIVERIEISAPPISLQINVLKRAALKELSIN